MQEIVKINTVGKWQWYLRQLASKAGDWLEEVTVKAVSNVFG